MIRISIRRGDLSTSTTPLAPTTEQQKQQLNNDTHSSKQNDNQLTIKSEKIDEKDDNTKDTPELNLFINNVVCSYSTQCHLNLRRIAMEGMHVEYKKENNMLNMKLRKPPTTATIWSSGKVTCAGAKSETDAYTASRRYCRILQKMKFKVNHFEITSLQNE
jgi:transcription initiation factor TFIID TATA-box-binding protein